MSKSMKYQLMLGVLFACFVWSTASPDRQRADEIDSSEDSVAQVRRDDVSRRRKVVVHEKPYNEAGLSMELFRETLSRHSGKKILKDDPCRYMRCSPGEECDIQEGRAQCVCKKHCKQRHSPLCGTDDEYYENHCEMHRRACLSRKDIYDARHKDCFYKVSECSGGEMRLYQNMIMQFYRNVLSSVEFRHTEKMDVALQEEDLTTPKVGTGKSRRKRSVETKKRKNSHKKYRRRGLDVLSAKSDVATKKVYSTQAQDEFDVATTTAAPRNPSNAVRSVGGSSAAVNQVDTPTKTSPAGDEAIEEDAVELLHAIQSRVSLDSEEEEIMTKDPAGEMVKYIFALLDLDSNGRVGSDEIGEITSLQHLDNVLPGPCNLFHVLKYGDENNDRTLDISETFQLFNISVLRLQKDERYIHRPAVYGSPTKLHCAIEGEPEPVWRRYGREVQEKNGAKLSGRILYLNDVTSKNAGNYTCTSRIRESMTQTIDLQILVAPRVEVRPRSQHPLLRSSATVKCHAEGRPRPAIRWERNGEPLNVKSGRYVLMANDTELHFNSVDEEDSAAYSCVAENEAGIGEEVGTLYVQDSGPHETDAEPVSIYFVFHQDGISVVNPHSCQVVRNIHANEKIPGLLLQDKLCAMSDNEARECVWGESVVVGFRFIYAAQPKEDRIIVVDKQLQRVVEVISTDLMPVQLNYVESTDQVFILCWIDEQRSSSLLQVVHSAAVAGSHFAEHIRPVAKSGHRAYDRSVQDIYIPPESSFSPSTKHGFVLHKNEQFIQRLDLTTLSYGHPIDLSSRGCVPHKLNYLPLGGLLHVSCVSVESSNVIHEIGIDLETDTEVRFEENTGAAEEFFSFDYSFVIKLLPHRDMITLYNLSESGAMHEFMIIRTNFQVADVHFSRKKYNPDAMVAYMAAKNQGNIMYVDLNKKKVEVIDGMTTPVADNAWPWKQKMRKLTSSGWYESFLASAGRTGLEIVGLNTNQILCRMDQFVHATAVSWSIEDL